MKRVLILVAFVMAMPLSSQTPPDRPWSAKGELSYVATTGNSDTQSLGLGGELLFERGVWASEAKASFVRAEANGEENARALAALVGVSRDVLPRLDAYARLSYLQNEFAGIEQQTTIDAGAAFELVETERTSMKIEAGLGRLREERLTEPTLDFATARAGFTGRWKFLANGEIAENLSLVQSLERSENWRLLNVFSVSAALNSMFSLKVSHTSSYINAPAAGFEELDTITSAGIVASF